MAKINYEERLFGNDNFLGAKQSEENATRFLSMVNVAKALAAKNFASIGYDDANDPHHRNCSVIIDLKDVGFTYDYAVKRGFVALLNSCDSATYSTLGGKLRLSFSVFDVWSDGEKFERPGFISREEEDEIERLVDEDIETINVDDLPEIK